MARGEEQSAAVATAQGVGGDGTSVHISGDGTWVQVEVTRTLRAGSGVLAGASWELSAEAQSRREPHLVDGQGPADGDRKSTRLNSSHVANSYAVLCLKKK